MRAEYLFRLANMCGITPAAVDRLKCSDFFLLIVNIDRHMEENQP